MRNEQRKQKKIEKNKKKRAQKKKVEKATWFRLEVKKRKGIKRVRASLKKAISRAESKLHTDALLKDEGIGAGIKNWFKGMKFLNNKQRGALKSKLKKEEEAKDDTPNSGLYNGGDAK